MLKKFETETDASKIPWVDLRRFIRNLKIKAYDHHNLEVATLKGMLILAGDADTMKNDPELKHWGLPNLLFTSDHNLMKAMGPFLAQKDVKFENIIYVETLLVDDECRGRGYGSEMLTKLAEYKDIAPIVILRASPLLMELEDIPKRQHKAVKDRLHEFYKKAGFTNIGEDTFVIKTESLEVKAKPKRHMSLSLFSPN